MTDETKIKVVLADDHSIMRDGLKALFRNHPNIEVVAETEDGITAGRIAREAGLDVITIGLNLGGINNIETVRQLSHECPRVKIVAHSMFLENAFVSDALRAGVSAYVHKEHAFPELIKAINAAMGNELYLCPKVASVVMNGYLKNLSRNGVSSNGCLTDREREVLKLLADGKSAKEIALDLHLSIKTVDTHRRQIMSKLGLYSLPQLTKYAIRCGLTSID